MLPIGAIIRLTLILVMVLIGAGGLWYVTGLRADLAVSQENTRRMTEAVAQQQAAMAQMQAEQAQIRELNAKLNTQIALQNRDVENLRDRFQRDAAGNQRNLGATAAARPEALERAVNRGTVNALRCLEIASGAPLTAAELAATKPSEINRECSSIANPNYKPAPGQ
jgi:TolA-binding protein